MCYYFISSYVIVVITCPATSYSCRGKPPTTIGAEELNYRVRDGNGCDLFAIATRLFELVQRRLPVARVISHSATVANATSADYLMLVASKRSSLLFYLFAQNRIKLTLMLQFRGNQTLYFLNWLSPRSISIRQLRTSPYLHPGPINLIISEGSYLLA